MSDNTNQLPALTPGECRTLRLQVPEGAPEYIVGTHGFLWQWLGDGATLVALTVTARQNSRVTAAVNLPDTLRRQLDQHAAEMTGELRRVEPEEVLPLAGATGIITGSVSGQQYAMELTYTVTVTSDGQDLYIVEVLAADSDAGQGVANSIIASASF